MECIATDSYRLAKKIVELDSAVENLINIVIPGKNIGELAKILNDNDENVEIHIFSNKILFKFDNILFQSRLLNGTFPDTSRLIPDTFELEIKTDLDELYSVIDRAALLTSEKEKNVIKFETNENEAIVSSNTPEIGRVEERLAITKNNDKEIKIAFSSKFMMEALKTINSKDIRILLNSDIKPIILKTDEDENLIQLLLPIKTVAINRRNYFRKRKENNKFRGIIMKNYEINSRTLAIVPVGENLTNVLEEDNEFMINMNSMKIIEKSCEFFGSSYMGRRTGTKVLTGISHKSPIIIEESTNMIYFPTTSPRLIGCIWIALDKIKEYREVNGKILVFFKNGRKIFINISYGSFDNQYLRATKLEYILRSRKKLKN